MSIYNKCCCNCYMTNTKQGVTFWCKPFRVLYATYANWWIPRICLFCCIVFYFVVAFGFKIGVHLSVYDLNENISAREIMWHMANNFTSFIIAFYCIEWWRDGKQSKELKAYDLNAMRARDSDDNDSIFNVPVVREKCSDDDDVTKL